MPSFSHPICFPEDRKPSKLRKLWWKISEKIEDCFLWIPYGYRPSNIYYYIYHRILQSHLIDTKLEKGCWIDKVGLMEAGLLELVDKFVSKDEEDAFSRVYWDDDDGHLEAKEKMIEILYWKHVRKNQLEAEKDALWDDYHKKYPMFFKKISTEECKEKNIPEGCSELAHENNEDPAKRDAEFKIIMEKEKFIEEETQRILHLCVDVRQFLWT